MKGAAMDVPELNHQPEAGKVDTIACPGAANCTCGPKLEKRARKISLSDFARWSDTKVLKLGLSGNAASF